MLLLFFPSLSSRGSKEDLERGKKAGKLNFEIIIGSPSSLLRLKTHMESSRGSLLKLWIKEQN